MADRQEQTISKTQPETQTSAEKSGSTIKKGHSNITTYLDPQIYTKEQVTCTREKGRQKRAEPKEESELNANTQEVAEEE